MKRKLWAFNPTNLKIQLEIESYVIMHYVTIACYKELRKESYKQELFMKKDDRNQLRDKSDC